MSGQLSTADILRPVPLNSMPLALRCIIERCSVAYQVPGQSQSPRHFQFAGPSTHMLSPPLSNQCHPGILLRNELFAPWKGSNGSIIQDICLPLVQPQMPELSAQSHVFPGTWVMGRTKAGVGAAPILAATLWLHSICFHQGTLWAARPSHICSDNRAFSLILPTDATFFYFLFCCT